MIPVYTIEKDFDENERVTEGRNGRTYVSTRGRWQWVVIVGGVADAAYDTKREAVARIARLKKSGAR